MFRYSLIYFAAAGLLFLGAVQSIASNATSDRLLVEQNDQMAAVQLVVMQDKDAAANAANDAKKAAAKAAKAKKKKAKADAPKEAKPAKGNKKAKEAQKAPAAKKPAVAKASAEAPAPADAKEPAPAPADAKEPEAAEAPEAAAAEAPVAAAAPAADKAHEHAEDATVNHDHAHSDHDHAGHDHSDHDHSDHDHADEPHEHAPGGDVVVEAADDAPQPCGYKTVYELRCVRVGLFKLRTRMCWVPVVVNDGDCGAAEVAMSPCEAEVVAAEAAAAESTEEVDHGESIMEKPEEVEAPSGEAEPADEAAEETAPSDAA